MCIWKVCVAKDTHGLNYHISATTNSSSEVLGAIYFMLD